MIREHHHRKKWRKPLGYFLNRFFNLDPYRDFGILDEVIGGFLILALGLTTITVIFGKEVQKTWTQTSDADWQSGTQVATSITGTGQSAGVALAQAGAGWTVKGKPIGGDILQVKMLSASSGWAAADGGVILRTTNGGASWTPVASNTEENLWSLSFANASLGAAVGDSGTILQWNGTTWDAVASPVTSGLFAVTLRSDVGLAVGESGNILKWNGTAWTEETSPTGATLFGVSLASSTLGFAVGESGTILKWNGSSWSTVSSPTTEHLLAVHLSSSSFGIAVGEGGTVLHWNGSAWSKKDSGTTKNLNAVSVHSPSAALAGGASGTVTRFDGATWTASAIETSDIVYGVALPTTTSGVAVGSRGLVATYASSYATEGTYTSPTKDAGTAVRWKQLQWTTTTSAGTSIKLHLATNNDNATWNYLGPDGTGGTYYTVKAGQDVAETHSSARYARYRAYLSGNAATTPILQSVSVTWLEDEPEPEPEKPKEEPKPEEPKPEEPKPEPEKPKEEPKPEPPKEPTPEPPPEAPTNAGGDQPLVETPAPPQPPAPPTAPSQPEPVAPSGGAGATPTTPTLTAPQNNALVETTTPTFSWSAFSGVQNHVIEIAESVEFTTPLVQATIPGPTTQYTPTSPLSSGFYFWRVFGRRSDGTGAWSDIYTFTLTTAPPLHKITTPSLERPIRVTSKTITIEGITVPNAIVRVVITSNPVERTTSSNAIGRWKVEIDRALFDPGQHLIQAQTILGNQITPAQTIAEFFIPLPLPPPKNAAEAVARTVQKTTKRVAEVSSEVARKTVEQTTIAAEKTEQVIKENETEAKVALTATVPIVTAANPGMYPILPHLHSILYHFFSSILASFGRKRKRKPWGTVYNAITKEPIGLAIVRLFNVGTKKLVETQVTDGDGRFGFLPKEGEYRIEVVKQDFASPSKIVDEKTDAEFEECYHGETIKAHEGAINVSIPLDPLETKSAATKRALKSMVQGLLRRFALPLLILGWAGSWIITIFSFSPTNLTISVVYLFFSIFQVVVTPKQSKSWGVVFAKETLAPVPLAVISIIDTKFNRVLKSRLTDYAGRFSFLPPAGEYKLQVKKQGFSFPVKEQMQTRKYKNLYYGQPIVVKKNNAIVNTDIPLAKA